MILTCLTAGLLCLATSMLISYWPRLHHSEIAPHQGTIRLTGYFFLMIELMAIGRQRKREQHAGAGADL